MKNSQIHEGFDKKEIRDFLSLSIQEQIKKEYSIKKDISHYGRLNGMDYAFYDAEAEVAYHKAKLDCIKQRAALIELLKMLGWDEWDVSDETPKDHPDFWLSFIGTKEEYLALMKTLK